MWWNAITVGVLVDTDAAHLDWLMGVAELELSSRPPRPRPSGSWNARSTQGRSVSLKSFSILW